MEESKELVELKARVNQIKRTGIEDRQEVEVLYNQAGKLVPAGQRFLDTREFQDLEDMINNPEHYLTTANLFLKVNYILKQLKDLGTNLCIRCIAEDSLFVVDAENNPVKLNREEALEKYPWFVMDATISDDVYPLVFRVHELLKKTMEKENAN